MKCAKQRTWRDFGIVARWRRQPMLRRGVSPTEEAMLRVYRDVLAQAPPDLIVYYQGAEVPLDRRI